MKWVIRVSEKILNNRTQAIFFAVIFSFLPYLLWLSLAVIALIVLRKGSYEGLLVMILPFLVHLTKLTLIAPYPLVLIDLLLRFGLPFIGACLLRQFIDWGIVISTFISILSCLTIILFWYLPDFQTIQLKLMKIVLAELQSKYFIEFSYGNKQFIQLVMKTLLGCQAVYLLGLSLLSLVFARIVQSILYNRGGFLVEVRQLKAHWFWVFFLVMILVQSTFEDSIIASNLIPMIGFYFILTGFSFLQCQMDSLSKKECSLLNVVAILTFPISLIPLIFIGVLDSLFNFRKITSLSKRGE